MKHTTLALLFVFLTTLHAAAVEPKRPINLLFIITDQQRWDALGCMGNKILKTPNLDKLAAQGARFTNFYTACPVCAPARTSILTGHSNEANSVKGNNDIDLPNVAPFPSFDQVLLRSGYKGEYHGKYHSPYHLALDYSEPVMWLNGKKVPEGSKAETSESDAFKTWLDKNVPKRELKPGELTQSVGIYTPIELDERFGKADAPKPSQAESYGRLEVPKEYSLTAFTAKNGLEALDRLKDGPFTLTISIGPPHPPMITPEPYYSMYPPQSIPAPASLNDARTNSPYEDKNDSPLYRRPLLIKQMKSIYYGMITEADEWIGKILARLDELKLTDNTLVIFTSDHGEMLGDHGMHGKFVFYEGSSHVNLLMRLPGVIKPNTVVTAPAGHIDLFPTILDYLERPGHESHGQSLRPLIEGRNTGKDRVAVSEWPANALPGFMVCDGRYKFMFASKSGSRALDALYDLQNDPEELNNLIGKNPERATHRIEAERMKSLLMTWLERTKSQQIEDVRKRPVMAD
ncbi:sulfatase [soil metagenome]